MMTATQQQKVIVAPLNWGWGHAARCIPIIKKIEGLGLVPVIASDGDALVFLKKEFPTLEYINLPSYGIKYHRFFVGSMMLNLPKIALAIFREHCVIKKYISKNLEQVSGLISDNRLGVYHAKVKSIYITHLINIRFGVFSKYINGIHHYFIKKHQECWVPDELGSQFTGALSKSTKINPVFIGILSRFQKQTIPKKYDLLVLLSGIEGQRNALEKQMSTELKKYKGSVLLVRGTFKPRRHVFLKNVEVVDFLLSKDLEACINASHMVLSRSGYTTVMDMAKLQKQVFYIPTPKQTEQEYLAAYLQSKKIASFANQKLFTIEMLPKKREQYSFKKERNQLLDVALLRFFKPFQV